MKIIADAHIPFVENYFAKIGELVLKPGREISTADVKEAEILLVRSITQVNEKLLAGSKIKFVGSVTAGEDHLDIEYLAKAGIMWATAAGFNAPAVADYIVCVIAALQDRQLLLSPQKKAAIIGVGNTGRLVEKHLRALNFDIVLCDPFRASLEPDFHSIKLEEINNVDLISLHVPLSHSGPYATFHMIDEKFMQRQKQDAVLINASRGAVLDSRAFLKASSHLNLCLDVFEHEPNIDKAILEQALIATPHIAGYSVQSKRRGIDMVYQAACKANIIPPSEQMSIAMPRQSLRFAGEQHSWRDVVLEVFNPVQMTSTMRTRLLPAGNHEKLFDELRHQFNDRHEFAFTDIKEAMVQNHDLKILQKLGMTIAI